MNKTNSNFTKYVLGILAIFAILIWIALWQKPDNNLHAYFLDVGQGDSIYVRTMNNTDLIIDGGPNNEVLTELSKIMPFYDRKIDYLILTHPHSDHISGLIEVIKRYEIGQIISSDATHTSAEYLEWLTIIKEKNIPFKLTRDGDLINLDQDTNLKIFWPKESYLNKTVENLNNVSVVAKLSYHDIDFMFTGDAEKEVQTQIIKNHSKDELQSEIYKVAHHGSDNAASESFIKVVKPELSVICVGENNKFGHPQKVILDLLAKAASQIFRTDQNGRIEVISDGQKYWTKSKK